MTKTEGMVNINLMSDNHLLNSIALLRRNIMMTKLHRELNHENTS